MSICLISYLKGNSGIVVVVSSSPPPCTLCIIFHSIYAFVCRLLFSPSKRKGFSARRRLNDTFRQLKRWTIFVRPTEFPHLINNRVNSVSFAATVNLRWHIVVAHFSIECWKDGGLHWISTTSRKKGAFKCKSKWLKTKKYFFNHFVSIQRVHYINVFHKFQHQYFLANLLTF